MESPHCFLLGQLKFRLGTLRGSARPTDVDLALIHLFCLAFQKITWTKEERAEIIQEIRAMSKSFLLGRKNETVRRTLLLAIAALESKQLEVTEKNIGGSS